MTLGESKHIHSAFSDEEIKGMVETSRENGEIHDEMADMLQNP